MSLDSIIEDASRRDWETPVDGGPLRMAIVGLGWFGSDVGLAAAAEASNAEATAVVSGSAEKASTVAEGAGVDHALTYEQFHEGEAADAYDAVYVTTPNATHLEYARTAADLGKHVLCEKPLETSEERAERLVEACDDAGVTLMTAYRMQLDPLVRRMRELVDAGAIGDPVRAEGAFGFDILAGGDADQWRLDPDLAGGGALLDVGVYPMNTTRFVLDAEPTAVSAHTASVREELSDVDEHVTFRLEFDGGTVLTAHASYGEYGENYLRIAGTEGRLTLDPGYDVQKERTLSLERADGAATVTDDSDEIVAEFDYFAQCALNGEEPGPDGRDGLRDMEIVEAIYESDESGSDVSL
jgi:xylose dehydrogenase (NAD/NADP)